MEKVLGFFKIPVVRRLLKLYLYFGIAHTCWKIFNYIKSCNRADALWEKVPGGKIDYLAKELIANVETLPDWMVREMRKYPNADLIKIPSPGPILLANTPKAVKWILKDEFLKITKPKYEDTIFELMGSFLGTDGIFVLRHGNKFPEEHKMWEKERKLSSLIFTKRNMKNTFYNTFVEKAKNVENKLNNCANSEIDIQEMFFSFTMDSIERFFMGTEVNTVEGGMSEYGKAFDLAHYSMMKYGYSTIIVEVCAGLLLPYPFGCWTRQGSTYTTPLAIIDGLFKQSKRDFYSAIRVLDKHIYKYIESTKKDPNLKNRTDVIATFLNSKEHFSDKQIHDVVLNLTIAGRDTTACALSWLIFELTQNLEVQERLIKEIDTTLNGKVPSFDELETENMPYLNGVLYETLRLHPSVPVNEKIASEDLQYYDGTIVPKGTILLYCPYALGRNEKTFPEPDKFDPERWIPFTQPSLYEFPVFQAGPRFCLGKDMAQFEIKFLVCTMLQKFRFKMRPEEAKKITYSLMLTLSVVNDEAKKSPHLWVTPEKR